MVEAIYNVWIAETLTWYVHAALAKGNIPNPDDDFIWYLQVSIKNFPP